VSHVLKHSKTRHAAQHTTGEKTRHAAQDTQHNTQQEKKQDTQHSTQQEKIQPTNSNTHAHRGDLYIKNISNNRRRQFPRPIILTLVDDHIGRNMQ
jgi:hypothetical protein